MKINEIVFIKNQHGLFPSHENDVEIFRGLTNGQAFSKGFKKVRNYEYHKMYFDFLNNLFRFQDQFDNFERFRKRLTMLAGFYDEEIIIDENGKSICIREIHSVSFDKMDEYRFRELFSRTIDAAIKQFGHNENSINMIMSYT